MKKHLICLIIAMGVVAGSIAQQRVRPDDHFWRRRVVNRISLVEKMNQPLVFHESDYYNGSDLFPENQGIVSSLMNGLKQGKYLAYDPYDWAKAFTYDDVTTRMKEFDQALTAMDDPWQSEESPEEDFDVWGAEFDEEPVDEDIYEAELDLGPYEEVIHMVEDWIFDKGRSMMVHQIDFFEVIWVDPSGILPEKVLARFMWKDVQDQLRRTQWKSRYNDATNLSIAQAFDLRLFHGFMIDVGGRPVRTLWEAEERRQEIVEFEHHLWSY